MIDYLLLGVLQGLTEFLPVSSSGHLVLAQRLLGMAAPGLVVEACLHLGTLVAVLVAFRADLAKLLRAVTPRGSLEQRKEIGYLLVGTAPVVLVGLIVRGTAAAWFDSLWVLAAGWAATAVLLIVASGRVRAARAASPSAVGALVIGVAQAAALVPGVSRSGFSIGAGILTGLRPDRAARFSFLLAMPAVAGAGGLALWDGLTTAAPRVELNVGGLIVGTVAAFAVGLAALRVLLALVSRRALWPFAVYCLGLAAWALALAASGAA